MRLELRGPAPARPAPGLINRKDASAWLDEDAGMKPGLIAHATRNVPRYTSYPTAPHFRDAIASSDYGALLAALPGDTRLSVYLHVPFCREICHYCGCHTKAARRPEPVAAYAALLRREIALVASRLPERLPVVHIHWGGGTPSLLAAADFAATVRLLRERLAVDPHAEHAIELDPRTVGEELVASLAAAGVNRASLGVQDFNETVQRAIGRIQPFATVANVVARLRSVGIGAINLDLMYGLPHQTVADVARTADLAASLSPGRIALFGYAHVPWMKTHQRLIDAAALPGAIARMEQSEAAAQQLEAAGYIRIGIDHFARRDDPLAIAAATGSLRRNFQGYTTDPADALIGLGASAIGRLPRTYVQNAPDIGGWRRAIEGGRLPVVRGKHLCREDLARAEIIERIMCEFAVDADAIFRAHGLDPAGLAGSLAALDPLRRDGLLTIEGLRLHIPAPMRAFARLVASAFDAYLNQGAARHSVAV